MYFNLNGNPGMATGGSGDVLTGIVSSLLAQGLEPLKAATLAAFLHGLAGEIYIRDHREHTLTASNLLELIEEAFREIAS
jgi:NAD(P)H-hydrate epimerase